MHSRSARSRGLLGKTLPLWLCLAQLGCGASSPPPVADGPLHLVIDAGSSGTRLCLYAIQQSTAGSECRAPLSAADLQREICERLPEKGGLATLTPAAAADRLKRGLELPFVAAVKARIRSATLLATGGMRALPPADRQRLMAYLQTGLAESFAPQSQSNPNSQTEAPAAVVRAAVLSGAEEARLAWRSVRQRYGSNRHAILETGGASVQLACGDQASGQMHASSRPLGMNAAFERVRASATAADPANDFALCFPFGTANARTDFAGCRALIRRTLFARAPAAEQTRTEHTEWQACTHFARTAEQGNLFARTPPLYALGSSWKAIFRGMQTLSLSRTELLRFGQQVCANRKLTAQERTSPYLQKRCWLYAYQSVLLEESGFDELRRGSDSWTRGASVDRNYVPFCGPPGSP